MFTDNLIKSQKERVKKAFKEDGILYATEVAESILAELDYLPSLKRLDAKVREKHIKAFKVYVSKFGIRI